MNLIQLQSLNQTRSLSHPVHPYYPVEAELVHYIANDYTVIQLLSIFAAGCVAILGTTRYIAHSVRPALPTTELLTIMWFVLSGAIHMFFEGYFALNYKELAGMSTLFGQLWKEYALADSRYLTQDPFVLCMETVTAALWGPLCWVVAGLIAKDHPLRHPLQTIVSMGQLYGDLLYYATSMFDHYCYEINYSRPERFYFWGYYFFMNFIWIVIPAILIYNSAMATCKAHQAVNVASQSLQKSRVRQDFKKTK